MAAIGLADLPDDVRDLIEPHAAESPVTLDAIGVALCKKRDEAKAARTNSGVEITWKECEEAYIGIDDANRHEFSDARWSKPMSIDGPVTTNRRSREIDHKSTVFVRLTARYVDAGAAKLAEILLPADDKAFAISEMPVPELIKAKDDTSQVVHEGLGVPLTRPAKPGEPVPAALLPPQGGAAPPAAAGVAGPAAGAPIAPPAAAAPMPAPGALPGAPSAPAAPPQGAPQVMPPGHVPLTVRDLALEHIEIARKKAKAAETRIYDWMVACQYRAQMRLVINDGARIGVGVLKAPVPQPKREIVVTEDNKDAGITIEIREKINPAAVWVDPWNIFPDPACGANVHGGDYLFERDYLSRRQVRRLKLQPGYIASQIDAVLAEDPEKFNKDNDSGAGGAPGASRQEGRYEIWYYHGSVKREEMEAIDEAAGKPPAGYPADKDEVYAIATLINDRVVRATVNPLDSGELPYHSWPWQRRGQHWAGIGVAEQIKTPQKIVNGAMRALLNNAGKSAGSQVVLDQGAIIPADGQWMLTPDKIWYKKSDAEGSDVRAAFQLYEIPNVTDQMLKILETGERLGEEATSIPLITQGQSGATTPDTFGAAQLQNNNANQLLRGLGYSCDECITEPVVRQFYEWLLLDPDIPDAEKGEFTIDAHGSIALVERAIQDQTIGQMGALVLNPAYGMDPKRWAKLFLRSKRLDPKDVQYSDEEQQKIDAAPPPEAPQVTVAKIAADTAMKQLAAKQTSEQQSAQSEERIAAAANVLEGGHVQNEATRIAAERERTSVENTVKLHELAERRQLAMLDYANQHQITLAQAKVDLAQTAMTLQTQRDLNAADNAADARRDRQRPPQRPQHGGAKPPGQTPGRAGNGRAFEQGRPT